MTSKETNALLGNSLPLPETDEEDFNGEDALHEYWKVSILTYIGTDYFKQNYLNVKNEILTSYSLKEKKLLCYSILEKVSNIYEWEFPVELDLYNMDEIIEVFEFLEFIEYDHENFVCDCWLYNDEYLNTMTLTQYCKSFPKNIISIIEEQIDTNSFNELITIFLRTYNKVEIIEWFSRISEKLHSTIKLRNLEIRGIE